jgi:acyl-CoA synthetase (AMP-forming)/AMP-acid ligase II/acyl carrier protein/alpha-ketoglutarate-dependent taurine dioxygenase
MAARCATLVDLLRLRAREQPEEPAYIFLPDHADQPQVLSYGALDQRARSVAASLQAAGAERDRVLLLLPPGLEYIIGFFGCLYAGAVAVPAYPMVSRRRRDRLEAIAADAGAGFALAAAPAMRRLHPFTLPGGRTVRVLGYEACVRHDACGWQPPQLDDAALAFLQYTSGSTSAPRGVMISHRNVMYNEGMIAQAMRHSAQTLLVSWLPPHHDMGLIGGLLQPFYAGSCCVFMSPVAFLRRPLRWLETIARYRAHTSGAPDFAYRLCVERISPEQRAGLDLSHWRVAFAGAEPVREDTLDRFARAFEPCGFRREAFFPCYGLAEATLVVTAASAGAEPAICRLPDEARPDRVASWVSCGRALPDTEIAIVDPERRTRVSGAEVGEIWVRGPGVALGYWNRRDETEQTFRADLAAAGAGPFLRTGDLGFLKDGELFVTGRLKDLMILRGINHYPQDIEWTVACSHGSVRQDHSAAFSIECDGEERLVVVTEVERTVRHERLAEIISAIREAVTAEHEITVHAVVILQWGGLPKTSSGKVQRGICRERFLNNSLQAIAASILTPPHVRTGPVDFPLTLQTLRAAAPPERLRLVETSLIQFLANALDLPASGIEPGDSLAALGVDSLAAVDLQNSLESHLGIRLPMAQLLDAASLSQCARTILDLLGEVPLASGLPDAVPQQTCCEYPLSHGQQALWFLYRLMPESRAYHIAQALSIRGSLDIGALRRALRALTDRHESLRTIFLERRGEPLQRVLERVDLVLTETEAPDASAGEVQLWLSGEMLRGFDLEQGPPVRASLLRQSPQQYVLLVCLHHIVADGWSLRLLVQELWAFYAAFRRGETARLPALAMRYADFVLAQRNILSGSGVESQFAYWKAQLANASVLRLPADRAPISAHGFSAGSLSFVIPPGLTRELKDLGRHEGATLFMTLLAMFMMLLHDRSRQDDIVVGTDFLNRQSAASRNLVGYLVNQLVLRTDLSGNPTCHEAIARVRAVALAAYAHADVPFQQLVSRLAPDRQIGQNPLFQIMFTFRNVAIDLPELADLSVAAVDVKGAVEKFDLTMAMELTADGLNGSVGYNSDLFEAATVQSMVRDFEWLLGEAAADPDQTLASLRARRSSTADRTGSRQGGTGMFPKTFGGIRPRKIAVSSSALVTREELAPGAAKFAMLRPVQGGIDPVGWARERRDELAAELRSGGAVLLRGFGVKSVPMFEALAQAVSSHLFSQNGEHPRESISNHIQTPVAYPSRQKLLWHNENSFNHCWPTKLWFCCVKPAEQGGETPLVDSREVFQRIRPGIREKFLEKQVMYVRTYGDGLGLDWRTVFGTARPDEVEKFCAANGLQWEWKEGDRLMTRCIRPAAVRHPQTGEMTWFNQAQHWHLSCLDAAVRESLLALYRHEDLPRNCLYGDGSAIEDAVMAEILDVYRTLEVSFPWQEGDVLMLDNLLVAHARNPYVGERKLLVAMGDMESYDSIGAGNLSH